MMLTAPPPTLSKGELLHRDRSRDFQVFHIGLRILLKAEKKKKKVKNRSVKENTKQPLSCVNV